MRSITGRLRSQATLIVFAILLTAVTKPSLAETLSSAEDPIAYIDTISPSSVPQNNVVTIKRHGRDPGSIGNHYALLPEDEVVVTVPGAVVLVRVLATNLPIAVTYDSIDHKYSVPKPSIPGFPRRYLSWFIAAVGGVDQAGDGSAMAASRVVSDTCYNEAGETNKPTEFRIPILVSSRSKLASGNRALFVSWQGGAPPFSLTLSSIDTGKLIAQTSNLRGTCSAYLPRTELRPGQYRLVLTDAHGVEEQEDSLFIVDGAPAEPRELRDANLPEEARRIYAATWLAAQDRGAWAFEAQQRVAAMDCRSAAAQEWLRRWGGSVPCNETKR